MQDLIGRQKEVKILEEATNSKKSEFVALYGRRRVGKTFLVREFFNYKFDFQLTGLANASTQQQLVNFHVALLRHQNKEIDNIPKNWFQSFQNLISYLETIEKKEKITLFFDELPWFDTKQSDFLMALEHFWNSWATNRKDILLITCGSAASWMINKLINNHGGLHNRVTRRMKIQPFNLYETELMLQAQNSVLDRYQILQIYMVTGGIPFYLENISSQKSAAQNIENLCFTEDGLLVKEFSNLFASLFKNSANHELIIKALSSKNKGLTRKQLLQIIGKTSSGNFSKNLEELEESGFISRYNSFVKKRQEVFYRLSDFYCHFYLKFIQHNTNFSQGVWLNAIDNPRQRAWSGYAFEQICLAHIPQIKDGLSIGGVLTEASSWRSKNAAKDVQIDLLIDRRDQVINLCEAKYSIQPFTITKSYAENLRQKIGTFKAESQTRKAVFLTMITTYGVTKNSHAAALLQNELTMDTLFQK